VAEDTFKLLAKVTIQHRYWPHQRPVCILVYILFPRNGPYEYMGRRKTGIPMFGSKVVSQALAPRLQVKNQVTGKISVICSYCAI